MSQSEQKADSVEAAAQPESASAQSQEEAFVPRKAYQEVTTDMHKFKNRSKNLQAELEAIKAERDAERQSELERQQEFEKLYNEEKQRRAQLEESLTQSQRDFQNSMKKSALKAELGGVKDEYLVFANLEEIELLDDGRVDPDSLLNAANKFRQSHPELISKPANTNITENSAPIEGGIKSGPVDVSKMTQEERVAYYYANFGKKN